MVGIAINASSEPAVKTFKRSLIGKKEIQLNQCDCEAARIASPTTAMPKKPSTTDGIAAMNSMYGLISFFSLRPAISLT